MCIILNYFRKRADTLIYMTILRLPDCYATIVAKLCRDETTKREGKITKCLSVDWEFIHGHSLSAEIDKFIWTVEPTVERVGFV